MTTKTVCGSSTSRQWLSGRSCRVRLAEQLGVRTQPQRPLDQSLADFLRSTRVLLVLDNCEHLVDACATLSDGLLRACPELRILDQPRAGVLAYGQQQYEESVRLLEQALEMFRQLGDTRGVGGALQHLGTLARHRADLNRAAAYYEASLSAFREAGDSRGVVTSLAGLGSTTGYIGMYQPAMTLLEESQSLARQIGYERAIAIVSNWIGKVAHARGDNLQAAEAFREGLTVARKCGDAWLMAECLEGLAACAGVDGGPQRGTRLLGAAATLRSRLGSSVPPVDRPMYDQTLTRIRMALSSGAFAAAWAAGEAMPLDEVIKYALEPDPAGPSVTARVGTRQHHASELTSREREVAALIARGLSNRQIG